MKNMTWWIANRKKAYTANFWIPKLNIEGFIWSEPISIGPIDDKKKGRTKAITVQATAWAPPVFEKTSTKKPSPKPNSKRIEGFMFLTTVNNNTG